MEVACLDLEGVLIPEIWIAFAEKTGIDELRATTRDIPDYDVLMWHLLALLDEVVSPELLQQINAEGLSALSDEQRTSLAIDLMKARNKVTHIYELVKAFADSIGATPRFIIKDSTAELLRATALRTLRPPRRFCGKDWSTSETGSAAGNEKEDPENGGGLTSV